MMRNKRILSFRRPAACPRDPEHLEIHGSRGQAAGRHVIGMVLLLALSLTSIAHAEVYTWTDANGVVHYSDSPNQENAQIINLAAPTPLITNASEATTTPPEEEASSSGSAPPPTPEQKQQAIDQQQKLEKYCTDLKYNYSMLIETGRRVYQVLPNGKTHYFNDNERQQQISKTKQELDLYCNPNNPPATSATPSTAAPATSPTTPTTAPVTP